MKKLLLMLVAAILVGGAEANAQVGPGGPGGGFGPGGGIGPGGGFGFGGALGAGARFRAAFGNWAPWGVGNYGFGNGYAYGLANSFTAGTVVPPGNLTDHRLPYFSLYPAVYYSYPVPRPYGYSPFAYPGWTPTPHVESMEPQLVVNPYIETQESEPAAPQMPTLAPAAPAKPISSRHASRSATPTKVAGPTPLRMLNPFFGDVVAGTDR